MSEHFKEFYRTCLSWVDTIENFTPPSSFVPHHLFEQSSVFPIAIATLNIIYTEKEGEIT